MASLFNETDNAAMVKRIEAITNESKPQWGKMNAAQMLAHCEAALKATFGQSQLKRNIIGVLFGSYAKKKFVTGTAPFGKNLPTDKSFVIKDNPPIGEKKQNLVALVKNFAEKGPGAITTNTHPIFGKMTPHEWDLLTQKHLDHHLRQFGA